MDAVLYLHAEGVICRFTGEVVSEAGKPCAAVVVFPWSTCGVTSRGYLPEEPWSLVAFHHISWILFCFVAGFWYFFYSRLIFL